MLYDIPPNPGNHLEQPLLLPLLRRIGFVDFDPVDEIQLPRHHLHSVGNFHFVGSKVRFPILKSLPGEGMLHFFYIDDHLIVFIMVLLYQKVFTNK
jgi:hypothetical protein